MDRRLFLKGMVAASALSTGCTQLGKVDPRKFRSSRRVRPSDSQWPSVDEWNQLNIQTNGRLMKLASPFSGCATNPASATCNELLSGIKNPYYIRDCAALTQTSGWLGAWQSTPSAYAIAVENSADVVAAVNFARKHNLRLVVKGGGHSYLGTSNSPDSLLVWMRPIDHVTLHESFVPEHCPGASPEPAVSVGAGAVWAEVYGAVTTRGGRYVQGGGCTTVGVAGLVQSGGFGSFSKAFGTSAAGLLEAEVVTADGHVRTVNACNDPDLFWAIKGGGGGSFGIVTRVTLRTHPLPDSFGAVFGAVQATSENAFRSLIAKVLDFYRVALFNPHWGEQISFRGDNRVRFSLVFQGLSRSQVEGIWQPFVQWVESNEEYSFIEPIKILSVPAQHFWDAEYFRQHLPGLLVRDDRPSATPDHVVWAGDKEEAGWYIHSYQSTWLPSYLLSQERQHQLASSLFASTRHWDVQLHFNKGLAGASGNATEATRNTATNPNVLEAFALAIIAGGGPPAYADMPNSSTDSSRAHADAKSIVNAMKELRKAAPEFGAYVSESDYFQQDWQNAYWGTNYRRLVSVKHKYDPEGLFIVHHGVGSEDWSPDGFSEIP